MPQLDVATFPSLLFWLAVSFLLLYVGLKVFILPHLTRIFDERQETIETFLEKAEELQKEAETLAQSSEKKLEEATATSQTMVTETVQNLSYSYHEQEQALTKNIVEKELEFERKNALLKQSIKKQLIEELPGLIEILLKEKMHVDISSKTIQEKIEIALKEEKHVP